MIKIDRIKSPLNYHGGKSLIAQRIINLMPPHTHYTEAFFGGGSVLFRKDPDNISEAINDIDYHLSNFWKVIRDSDLFPEFARLCELTPLSQTEWEDKTTYGDFVLDAWRFFVKFKQSRQGLGVCYRTPSTRRRRGMNENVSAWLSAVEGLQDIHDRLRRVEIRNMGALDFLRIYDHENAMHYLDPPYVHDTRVSTNAYKFEMQYQDHVNLLDFISKMRGKFILSGYNNDLYNQYASLYQWDRVEISQTKHSSSSKNKPKSSEVLWMNYV